MPNGNSIVAQAADGTQHVFPAGTDVSIIDSTMKQYAISLNPPKDPYGFATAGTGGGPEAEMLRRHARSRAGKDFTTPEPGAVPWLERQGGGALEATADLAKAVPGMLKTVGDLIFSGAPGIPNMDQARAIQSLVQPQVEQWQKGGEIGGIESLAHRGAALIPFAGPMAAEAGESLGRGEVGRGVVQGAAALAARPRFGGEPLGANTVREVMGEGPSKARLLADQHAHALATKQHLAGVADAVHADAQQAMSQVLAKVDEAHPEGAFSKADIQDKVKSAVGDLVQVPERMPPSVSKILKVEKPSWENLAATKEVSGLINRLRSGGLSDVEVRETLRDQGFNEREVRAAMTGGGAVSGDALTAEQLKQMRSDVGQELGRYGKKGTVGAALNKVYGVLSQELRGAAADSGVEREWLEANDRYTQFANDFIRGPLKRVLGSSTASGIMEPLTGATRQQLLDTLQKYHDAGFNIDMDTLQEEMRRYGMSKTVNRLSQPTKMDLLMAGFSPKALAIRQLGPRLMRNPKAIDMFAGEGFDTPISSRQVYPSKVAAMKAAKGGNGPKGGINAGGYETSLKPIDRTQAITSLSNELDTMKAKLRGATTASASDRAALESQIKDYQERLNELRGD